MSDYRRRHVLSGMRRRTLFHAAVIVLALAGAIIACNRTSPTDPGPPPSRATEVVTAVVVTGPESLPPGGTAQYAVVASFSDGSSRDVTAESFWRVEPFCCPTSSEPAMSVTASGVVAAANPGEATLIASFRGRSVTRTVFVLLEGTFRHIGTVRDDGRPLVGASVVASGGSAAGLTTTTNDDGRYFLYGLAGTTEIRVTKPGYVEQAKAVTVTSNDQSLVFDLVLSRPLDDVTGTYLLTITAAEQCTALPEELKERRFTAVLEQTGRQITARLQGTTFHGAGDRQLNTFQGTLEPQRLLLQFSGSDQLYFYTLPDLIERVNDSDYFTVWGTAALDISGSRISGALSGVIAAITRPDLFFQTASCQAENHRVGLVR